MKGKHVSPYTSICSYQQRSTMCLLLLSLLVTMTSAVDQCTHERFRNTTLEKVNCNRLYLRVIPHDLNRSGVGELRFKENHLGPNLHNDTFVGFSNLENLYLDRNSISKIDPSAFDPLLNLELLSLYENAIVTLDNTTFSNLTNLKSLALGGNLFDYMPNELFLPLVSLETMLLKEISTVYTFHIPKLGTGFRNMKNLKHLKITALNMPDITIDFFENLPNHTAMEILDLAANMIKKVHPKAFRHFTNLHKLNLDLNNDMSIEQLEYVLHAPPSNPLHSLSCFYCDGVTMIRNSTFKNTPHLAFITFSYSTIKDIELDAFSHVTKLKNLSLDANAMKLYNDSTFIDIHEHLLYLDISDCQFLTSIELSVTNMSQLTYLDVSGNPSLNAVNSTTFQGLHGLTNFFLYGCDLRTIENDTFIDMGLITIMDLAQNTGLRTLEPHALRGLVNLTQLWIDTTSIEALPDELLYNMTLLDMVGASSMQLLELQDGLFLENPNVTWVDFSNNRLEMINNTFQGMNNLNVLWLDRNGIYDFANESFADMDSLNYLDISEQRNDTGGKILNDFPATIRNFLNGTLNMLYIEDNNISVFRADDLAYFRDPALTVLEAYGNPYNCSCYADKSFLNFLFWFNTSYNAKIDNYTKDLYRCADPKKHRKMKISQFNIHECDKPFDYTALEIALPTTFIAVLLIIAVVCYVKQYSIRYYIFLIRQALAGHVFEDPNIYNPDYDFDVYVSHGHSDHHEVPEERQDYTFIIKEVMPNLSKHTEYRPFNLAVDFVNFLAGPDHCTQIAEHMVKSRKVLILLTRHYLASPQGSYELEVAYHNLQEHGHSVIIGLLQEVSINKAMPPMLQSQLKQKDFIEWTPKDEMGKKLFWMRLREQLILPSKAHFNLS